MLVYVFLGIHFYGVTLDLTRSANIVFLSAGFSGCETVKWMQLSLLFSLLSAGEGWDLVGQVSSGMKSHFERTEQGKRQ